MDQNQVVTETPSVQQPQPSPDGRYLKLLEEIKGEFIKVTLLGAVLLAMLWGVSLIVVDTWAVTRERDKAINKGVGVYYIDPVTGEWKFRYGVKDE